MKLKAEPQSWLLPRGFPETAASGGLMLEHDGGSVSSGVTTSTPDEPPAHTTEPTSNVQKPQNLTPSRESFPVDASHSPWKQSNICSKGAKAEHWEKAKLDTFAEHGRSASGESKILTVEETHSWKQDAAKLYKARKKARSQARQLKMERNARNARRSDSEHRVMDRDGSITMIQRVDRKTVKAAGGFKKLILPSGRFQSKARYPADRSAPQQPSIKTSQEQPQPLEGLGEHSGTQTSMDWSLTNNLLYDLFGNGVLDDIVEVQEPRSPNRLARCCSEDDKEKRKKGQQSQVYMGGFDGPADDMEFDYDASQRSGHARKMSCQVVARPWMLTEPLIATRAYMEGPLTAVAGPQMAGDGLEPLTVYPEGLEHASRRRQTQAAGDRQDKLISDVVPREPHGTLQILKLSFNHIQDSKTSSGDPAMDPFDTLLPLAGLWPNQSLQESEQMDVGRFGRESIGGVPIEPLFPELAEFARGGEPSDGEWLQFPSGGDLEFADVSFDEFLAPTPPPDSQACESTVQQEEIPAAALPVMDGSQEAPCRAGEAMEAAAPMQHELSQQSSLDSLPRSTSSPQQDVIEVVDHGHGRILDFVALRQQNFRQAISRADSITRRGLDVLKKFKPTVMSTPVPLPGLVSDYVKGIERAIREPFEADSPPGSQHEWNLAASYYSGTTMDSATYPTPPTDYINLLAVMTPSMRFDPAIDPLLQLQMPTPAAELPLDTFLIPAFPLMDPSAPLPSPRVTQASCLSQRLPSDDCGYASFSSQLAVSSDNLLSSSPPQDTNLPRNTVRPMKRTASDLSWESEKTSLEPNKRAKLDKLPLPRVMNAEERARDDSRHDRERAERERVRREKASLPIKIHGYPDGNADIPPGAWDDGQLELVKRYPNHLHGVVLRRLVELGWTANMLSDVAGDPGQGERKITRNAMHKRISKMFGTAKPSRLQKIVEENKLTGSIGAVGQPQRASQPANMQPQTVLYGQPASHMQSLVPSQPAPQLQSFSQGLTDAQLDNDMQLQNALEVVDIVPAETASQRESAAQLESLWQLGSSQSADELSFDAFMDPTGMWTE